MEGDKCRTNLLEAVKDVFYMLYTLSQQLVSLFYFILSNISYEIKSIKTYFIQFDPYCTFDHLYGLLLFFRQGHFDKGKKPHALPYSAWEVLKNSSNFKVLIFCLSFGESHLAAFLHHPQVIGFELLSYS